MKTEIKLKQIQESNILNEVFVIDQEHKVNKGHHNYLIKTKEAGNPIALISFQNGARNYPDSIPGVLNEDLLEIVKHRLESFQNGPFRSEFNEKMLFHVTQALQISNERMLDRDKRGVLGKNKV